MHNCSLAGMLTTASLAVMGLTACGDDGNEGDTDTPVAVIEAQASALTDGDCERAMALTVDGEAQDIADCEAQFGEGRDVEILEADVVDESDAEAQVEVTYETDGEEEQRTVHMVLDDGSWLID